MVRGHRRPPLVGRPGRGTRRRVRRRVRRRAGRGCTTVAPIAPVASSVAATSDPESVRMMVVPSMTLTSRVVGVGTLQFGWYIEQRNRFTRSVVIRAARTCCPTAIGRGAVGHHRQEVHAVREPAAAGTSRGSFVSVSTTHMAIGAPYVESGVNEAQPAGVSIEPRTDRTSPASSASTLSHSAVGMSAAIRISMRAREPPSDSTLARGTATTSTPYAASFE